MVSSVIERGPFGPGGGGHGFDGGPMVLIGPAIALSLLILFAVFLVLAALVVRRRGPWARGSLMAARAGMMRPTSAETILAERFARGEIDKDEFVQRRAVLRGEPLTPPPAAATPPAPANENIPEKTERIPPTES
jgi:putative membrane protein